MVEPQSRLKTGCYDLDLSKPPTLQINTNALPIPSYPSSLPSLSSLYFLSIPDHFCSWIRRQRRRREVSRFLGEYICRVGPVSAKKQLIQTTSTTRTTSTNFIENRLKVTSLWKLIRDSRFEILVWKRAECLLDLTSIEVPGRSDFRPFVPSYPFFLFLQPTNVTIGTLFRTTPRHLLSVTCQDPSSRPILISLAQCTRDEINGRLMVSVANN